MSTLAAPMEMPWSMIWPAAQIARLDTWRAMQSLRSSQPKPIKRPRSPMGPVIRHGAAPSGGSTGQHPVFHEPCAVVPVNGKDRLFRPLCQQVPLVKQVGAHPLIEWSPLFQLAALLHPGLSCAACFQRRRVGGFPSLLLPSRKMANQKKTRWQPEWQVKQEPQDDYQQLPPEHGHPLFYLCSSTRSFKMALTPRAGRWTFIFFLAGARPLPVPLRYPHRP